MKAYSLLLLAVFLGACTANVGTIPDEQNFSQYCRDNANEIYQCGEYIRVMENGGTVFYHDGERIECSSGENHPACSDAVHDMCKVVFNCATDSGIVDFIECGERRPKLCTLQYDPVCATIDTRIMCVTEPCPSSEQQTMGNACTACSNPDVMGYVPGECAQELGDGAGSCAATLCAVGTVCEEIDGQATCVPQKLAICDDVPEWINEETLSQFDCVSECPIGYDSFGTQIGLVRCIPHMGQEEFETLNTCMRSSNSCDCVKAERSTSGEPLDIGYVCLPEPMSDYKEYLVHTSGVCTKDGFGMESCAIA